MRFSLRAPEHRAFDENSSSLRIAKAAKRVFLRAGDAGFSMRNVAKEAGMSMGAVQHFYPTRDGLMLFTGPGTKHFTSRAALGRTVKAAVKRLLADSE